MLIIAPCQLVLVGVIVLALMCEPPSTDARVLMTADMSMRMVGNDQLFFQSLRCYSRFSELKLVRRLSLLFRDLRLAPRPHLQAS